MNLGNREYEKDPGKARLKELKKKPVLTPQETKEYLDRLAEAAGIKES